jgi:transcriptional regulator with XRE-family HTH domain
MCVLQIRGRCVDLDGTQRSAPRARLPGRAVPCRAAVGRMSSVCRVGVVVVEAVGRQAGRMNETRVADLRRERGWTQDRLAEASGITVRTVQRLEAGNDASLETLSLVAKALEVPVRHLFGAVGEGDFGRTVSALDDRAERQQERRDAVTDGYRSLYTGVGIVWTLLVVAGIATHVLPGVAALLIGAYWAGGALLSRFLFRVVVGPRLDRAYPLSRDRTSDEDGARTRARGR